MPRNAPQRLEVGDVAEIGRFEAKVVRGPGPDDCWIWTGAIGDDGYGRFAIRRDVRGRFPRRPEDGREVMVRPPRYAVALYVGTVPAGLYALHDRCDNPICVRAAEVDGRRPHVVLGTQQENLTTMGARGRSYGGRPIWQHDGLTRAQRVARSRALRLAVRGGWDAEAVRRAMLIGSQPALFDPVEDS
ncbi:hypothetical protein CRH09_39650 (plasmid) [Nocardia terpenica]|uniref:Uncharacterized protein n=2 Tax=Nocardia terpenica TaxID=455432 RepID=A0A291RZ10_9NOCA|nr:hypothetical protein CRH09_39650 [Nocardia terpenica]